MLKIVFVYLFYIQPTTRDFIKSDILCHAVILLPFVIVHAYILDLKFCINSYQMSPWLTSLQRSYCD